MGVSVLYENGIFTPVEADVNLTPGKRYKVFSEEEILALTGDSSWLQASRPSFDFWDNDEDAVYDNL